MNRTFILGLLLLGLLVVGAGSCSKPPGQGEYDRALYELKRNNAVRAKALLEKSISRRPGAEENALAYNYLGVAAGKLGQFQAAQEAFEDSRRLGPKLLEPVLNLAQLAASSGDQLRALKLLEEAARMDERDTRALELMAVLYGQRQQWPEAQRMLQILCFGTVDIGEFGHQRTDVDKLEMRPVVAALDLRNTQQRIEDEQDLVGLGDRPLQDLAADRVVGIGGILQQRSQPRKRRPQIVGDIAGHLTQGAHGLREPIQHPVEVQHQRIEFAS